MATTVRSRLDFASGPAPFPRLSHNIAHALTLLVALGLAAGRHTQGHRFEAARERIELRDADSYAAQLETEGAVIAGFAARRAEIVRPLPAAAADVRTALRALRARLATRAEGGTD